MKPTSGLAEAMRERADADGLPADHDVRTTADKLEDAAKAAWSDGTPDKIREMLRWWARARIAWNKYSGEPLI
jgi:hypothetical protein